MRKITNADFLSFAGKALAQQASKSDDKDTIVIGALKTIGKATVETIADSAAQEEQEEEKK
mgnify:CR=1 FL=1|jgi:hypothetical protein|tara:strand:+ start:2030 stop:2212 length:183 start_codon:yes stop_codon:yes gene_type:complete